MSLQALPAQAKQLFQHLFERASLGIAVEDLEGNLLLANPALCSMLGYAEAELCSMSCSEFANPEDSQDDWALFQKLRAGLIDHYSLEKRYVRKDGAPLWGRLNVSLSKNGEEGSSPLVFAFVEEITERKMAEQDLARTNDQLRLAMKAGQAVGWELDLKSGRESWFGNLQAMFGIASENFISRTEDFYGYVHPEDRQLVAKAEADAKESRKPYAAEFRIVRQDDTVRWVAATGKFYYSANGDPVRMLGMAADITERKRAEEALKQSDSNYRLFVSQSSEGIFCQQLKRPIPVVWPEDEQVQRILHESYMSECNDSLAGMYGMSPADFVGKPLTETVDAEDPVNIQLTRDYIRGGYRVVDRESHEVDAQGNPKIFLNSMTGVVENGMLLRTWGIQRDITGRRRAEEALKESEERERLRVKELEMILDAVPVPVLIAHDADCRRITGNRAAHEQLRVPTGGNFSLSAAPAERPSFRHVEEGREIPADLLPIQEAVATGKPVRGRPMTMLFEDGTQREEVVNVLPLLDEAGQPRGAVAASMDLTEQRQTERALRESEEKLRLLLDSTAEAIYGIDLEHRFTFCNPACLRALGFERLDQVLGKNAHELIHHTRPDGTSFPEGQSRIYQVIRSGEGVHADDEVMWRADGTVFPVEYWSYPQRKGKDVVGAVIAFIDITQRKLAEAALANVGRKLIEAQEQERTRIGRELHDDIGQRLALLAIELQQLCEERSTLPEVWNRMGELHKQTLEIAADIQSLSHELHSAKLQYLGIAAAMGGFCQEFGQQQKVEIDFRPHDLPNPLSPEISLCLFRVLQEALHNSAKHSGIRHIEVRLWGRADEIHLTVRDSGAGFDLETAKKGRGLGLISMEERLKLLNGTFSIESQPMRGTRIHARVPFSAGTDSMRAAGQTYPN